MLSKMGFDNDTAALEVGAFDNDGASDGGGFGYPSQNGPESPMDPRMRDNAENRDFVQECGVSPRRDESGRETLLVARRGLGAAAFLDEVVVIVQGGEVALELGDGDRLVFSAQEFAAAVSS